MLKKFFFFVCYISACISYAQSGSLTGEITDADDNMGIAGASVFINNTTFGTICDDDGNFKMPVSLNPPFELVISSVGYQTKNLAIDTFPALPLNIKLQQKTYDLGAVTIINPDKNGWEKYGKDFMENFIGYSPFAGECEILNKKDLEFRYDKDSYQLEVASSKPIIIRNKALGYTITYWLDDFKEDYKEHTVFFKGYSLFEPMKNKSKQSRWNANRALAYAGSVNHFMRAFFKGNILDEGFEMRIVKRIKNEDFGRTVPVTTDTIKINDDKRVKDALVKIAAYDSADQQKAASVAMQFLQWLHDSTQKKPIQIVVPFGTPDSVATKHFQFFKDTVTNDKFVMRYYDYDRLSPKDSAAMEARSKLDMHITGAPPPGFNLNSKHVGGSYDILYTDIIPIDTFRKVIDSNEVRFSFKDYLDVTYTKEMPDDAYLQRNHIKLNPDESGKEESLISIKNPEKTISVYANGNYADPYDLFLEKYWSYEKLDKLLPLDYEP